MKIVLLAVGRMRDPALKEICAGYLARLQHYGAVEVKEIRAADSGAANRMAADDSARLLAAVEPGDRVWVLDERGAQVTSVQLSAMLQAEELQVAKRLVVVLGGAYGVSAEVRARGKLLALSKLTLPHELCRALVLEQLYRARTIQRGQPYHHA